MPGFEVLYEDGPCLAVNKPSGLLTQAPPGIDSLEVRIKAFLKERGDISVRIKTFLKEREDLTEEVYLGLPHRLDRPVSGAMVFGLDQKTTRRLAAQFEKRKVRKTYWACVSGAVEPGEGTWVDHVRKLPGRPRAEIVGPDHEEGREAILHYRTLGATAWGSWLEIELETGRMHQIRIQATSRGHPVLGDADYGSTVPFGPQFDDARLRAIALHARTLEFRNPTTRRDIALTAPLPEPWASLGIVPL